MELGVRWGTKDPVFPGMEQLAAHGHQGRVVCPRMKAIKGGRGLTGLAPHWPDQPSLPLIPGAFASIKPLSFPGTRGVLAEQGLEVITRVRNQP